MSLSWISRYNVEKKPAALGALEERRAVTSPPLSALEVVRLNPLWDFEKRRLFVSKDDEQA